MVSTRMYSLVTYSSTCQQSPILPTPRTWLIFVGNESFRSLFGARGLVQVRTLPAAEGLLCLCFDVSNGMSTEALLPPEEFSIMIYNAHARRDRRTPEINQSAELCPRGRRYLQ